MSDKRQLVCIEDLAEVFDGPHATPAKTEHGPWYLSISSLKNGKVDLSESAHLSDEDFPTWTRRVQPRPGDTLFSYETRLGEAGHWSSEDRAALGRRMGLLRPRRDRMDPRFLTYAYISPQFQTEIRRRSIHGATVDRIPIAEIGQWPIAVPPLDEQHQVAGVLGAFDDLIDSLEVTCVQIDRLQRAIFLSQWDSSTRVPLSELSTITMGQSPPGETYNERGEGLPFYQGVKDFGLRHPARRVYCTGPTRLAHKGDVLIAVRAPIGDTNVAVEDCAIGRGIAALASDRPSTTLQALRSDQNLWSRFRGDGTVFAAVNKQTLAANRVPWAEDQRVETVLAPMDVLYRECWDEAKRLRKHRDELLPLLLSGRVRVEDVAGSSRWRTRGGRGRRQRCST